MISNLVKRIGLTCLFLASLTLTGCFHIPNEDWLPSKNDVNTNKDDETEEALNSFINGIDTISSEWNNMKNNENNEEIISAEQDNITNETNNESDN